MASRTVKAAMSEKAPERGMVPRSKVKAALPPQTEERPKKQARKPKRAMGR